MEWNSRGAGPTQPVAQPVNHTPGVHHKPKRTGVLDNMRFASVILLFAITALIVALVGLVMFGGGKSEKSYVKADQLQAVFLNGGQVYFGDITTLNDEYLRMSNIYYLRVNQTVQPNQSNNKQTSANDISLVKLGCELHGPTDEMLINRDQVVFWENLKSDGQVAKAVADYVKQNPNGQKCETNAKSNTNSNNTNNSSSGTQQTQNITATEETTNP